MIMPSKIPLYHRHRRQQRPWGIIFWWPVWKVSAPWLLLVLGLELNNDLVGGQARDGHGKLLIALGASIPCLTRSLSGQLESIMRTMPFFDLNLVDYPVALINLDKFILIERIVTS